MRITDFIRSVLPNFAYYHGVLINAFGLFPYSVDKTYIEFVNDVEPKSFDAHRKPFFYNALISENEFSVFFVCFINGRNYRHAPPTSVFVGMVREIVPVVVRRLFALISSCALIAREFVKILTVCSGMIKYAVKHYSDTVFLRLYDELSELLLVAEKRVYLHIVAGIVTVI